WIWPDNIRVGLADPSLTADQLREALRLLPTGEEFIEGARRAERITFADSVLWSLEPNQLDKLVKPVADPADPRHYHVADLDVLRTVRELSGLSAKWMDAVAEPLPEGEAHMMAYYKGLNLPQVEYPWPKPHETAWSRAWRETLFKFRMRHIPNSMVRYIPVPG